MSFCVDVPIDVSESEMEQLENVINHLNSWSEKLQPDTDAIDDDDICTICKFVDFINFMLSIVYKYYLSLNFRLRLPEKCNP